MLFSIINFKLFMPTEILTVRVGRYPLSGSAADDSFHINCWLLVVSAGDEGIVV